MTSSQARVLIVDDNAETVSVLRDILSREGYQISSAGDPKAAHSYLEKFSADMILTDLHLPQVDGLTFLSQVREHSKDIPVVLMTAYGSLRTAVEGLKAGAFDYLSKPFMDDEVRLVVRRALEQKYNASPGPVPSDPLPQPPVFENLIGSSPAMVNVYKAVARVAQADTTVLLQGESGTGKELIARAIHDNGPRSAGPFVTVDGSALAETLLESELFGHERDLSPGRSPRAKVCSNGRIWGHVSWTRSRIYRLRCKGSYFVPFKKKRFVESAVMPRRCWMSGLLRLRRRLLSR